MTPRCRCDELGDVCPYHERIAEQRAEPEPDDYYSDRAQNRYERWMWGNE